MPRQLVVDDNTDNVVTSESGHEIIIYVYCHRENEELRRINS